MKTKTYFDSPKAKYWINTCLYIAIVSFIIYVAFKLYVWYNVQMKIIKSNLSTEVFTDENGNKVSIDLGLKASQLYEAFHSGLFGWFEDENLAYNIIKSVPKELIPKLEIIYADFASEDLQEMFTKYTDYATFHPDWQTEINYLFS